MKIEKKIIDKLFTKNLKQLFNMFVFFGYEIRIVGGTVRDLILETEPRDIDIATNAGPYEIIYIFNELTEEREAVATHGIDHGTVVITFPNDEKYEVTSLDFKILVEKNKIKIIQDMDWKKDAERRDFTINAMSIDKDGNVYDYLNGIKDLKEKKIKFIGDYKERINEYPILILRFFKLLGKFKDPVYDNKIIDYIKNNINLLDDIKKDTIEWFISDIDKQPYAEDVKKLMSENDIDLKQFLK